MTQQPERFKLKRPLSTWSALEPAAVASGSLAQVVYALDDAKHDIASLALVNSDLLKVLEESANALEDIAERTWDKRHPDECKSACAEASDVAGGARDEAQAAIAKIRGGESASRS